MVIVNQGYRANDVAVRQVPVFLNQLVADQIAEGLGTVRITALPDVDIKLFQQIGIDGNADAAKLAHEYFKRNRRGMGFQTVARIARSCYRDFDCII
jgi:hypothetical protein